MGFNTTVVVLNDAVHDIARDPEFGARLAKAIIGFSGKPTPVSAGSHGNAAIVIETHHADFNVQVSVGGNTGFIIDLPHLYPGTMNLNAGIIDDLKKVDEYARRWHDGHYSLFAFTTNYRGCYGTPSEVLMVDEELNAMRDHPTMASLLRDMAENPSAYEIEPPAVMMGRVAPVA